MSTILMCSHIFKNQYEVPWGAVILSNRVFVHILWLSPSLNSTNKSSISVTPSSESQTSRKHRVENK